MPAATRPPKRRTRESVVPMINVVFLLLIFFPDDGPDRTARSL